MARKISVFVSYAHEDAEHYSHLDSHLNQLRIEGLIDTWIDREIQPGQDWNNEILQQLDTAQIVLFLVSKQFLDSEFVREQEIPRAVERAQRNDCTVIPIILEECDWQKQPFAVWQALPPTAEPVNKWHPREVAYAQIARGIAIVAENLTKEKAQQTRIVSQRRELTIYQHTPFRILGEAYDPFRAFEQVFRLAEQSDQSRLPPLPLTKNSLGDRIEFVHEDYQTILTWLLDGRQESGLPYDLVSLPYQLLGHCVEQGLIAPLDEDLLGRYGGSYVWWRETTKYKNRLYGVPLSALTMFLAIREDLFDQYGLDIPQTWDDYVRLVDEINQRRLPVAPELLQGRRHVTLWYDWLIHLYAHDSNDLVLYNSTRLPANAAASSLRSGTLSYLHHVAKLARHADGKGPLPHWAIANWDDGIEQFARGNLLMHWVFNDALDTLRRRLEVTGHNGPKPRVRFLPVPTASGSLLRNAHVEGWVLCVPCGSRYNGAANQLLNWFLDSTVQQEYVRWGGASANLEVLKQQAEQDNDRGAAAAYLDSVEDGRNARTVIDLVKAKTPIMPIAVERIVGDLYNAVIEVVRGMESEKGKTDTNRLIHQVTDRMLRRVEQRLMK